MNFEEFFDEVRQKRIELTFDNRKENFSGGRLDNEALFQLPLLAITVLLLSKDRSKPSVDQIGQLVGECFERTFIGFKGSSQHLGWSANLRIRTTRALTFLEVANLVDITKNDKKVQATSLGKKVIAKALEGDTDLSHNLRKMELQYRNIRTDRQLSLGL